MSRVTMALAMRKALNREATSTPLRCYGTNALIAELRERGDRAGRTDLLIEVAEAARALCVPPIACACSGPGEDSLPGECRCQTDTRKHWSRLAEALSRLDAA